MAFNNEGPLRVGVTTSVGSFWNLVVGASIKGSSWLVMVQRLGPLHSFAAKSGFYIPSGLVVNDCKPTLRGVLPQPMFLQRLQNLVYGEWLLRSFILLRISTTCKGPLRSMVWHMDFVQSHLRFTHHMGQCLWPQDINNKLISCCALISGVYLWLHETRGTPDIRSQCSFIFFMSHLTRRHHTWATKS